MEDTVVEEHHHQQEESSDKNNNEVTVDAKHDATLEDEEPPRQSLESKPEDIAGTDPTSNNNDEATAFDTTSTPTVGEVQLRHHDEQEKESSTRVGNEVKLNENSTTTVNTPSPPSAPASTSSSPAVTIRKPSATQSTNIFSVTTNKNNNTSNQQQQQQQQVHLLTKENEAFKEKISKLKALLGRSAKAQRETKIELDATQKRLGDVMKENEQLRMKVNKLANRPTHMEMLADFETNFDKALLAVGNSQAAHNYHHYHHQAGGQDTASLPAPPLSPAMQQKASAGSVVAGTGNNHNINNNNSVGAVMDTLLIQELNDSKQRIEQLEKLNQTWMDRVKYMENDVIGQYQRQLTDLKTTLQHTELEKKMAIMQADHSTKQLQQAQASIDEMQLEINLLTESKRKYVMQQKQHNQTQQQQQSISPEHVQKLEQQIQALQEWAVASNEAKTLAQERVRLLEQQLQYSSSKQRRSSSKEDSTDTKTMDDDNNNNRTISSGDQVVDSGGKIILSKDGSFVVGAGDSGIRIIELDEEIVKTITLSQRVVLRWKFDLQNDISDVSFSILQGKYEKWSEITSIMTKHDKCILVNNRNVKGGAEGETDHAFAVHRACTLVWNNTHSWIRPKTIKFEIDAIVF